MPAEQPIPKTEWLAAFSLELERLRGLNAGKLVSAIALQEWIRHKDDNPVTVARAWAKRAGPKT
jgi:hypothetical protein